MEFLNTVIFNNSVLSWLVSILVSLVLYGIFLGTRKLLVKRACKLAQKTETDIDDFLCDFLGEFRHFFLTALSLWLASRMLGFSENVRQTIRVVFILITILQGGFLLNRLVIYLIEKNLGQDEEGEKSASLKTIGHFVRGVVWVIAAIMALDSLPGVEVSTLVTTLGITGVAVAFAIQNVLADLFAALSITFDQPFVVGDVIVVDTLVGTVEKIGLKSTRVRSISGEQLIFSNSDLLNSRIRNYQGMERRRVVVKLGVAYQTPYEKLNAIPKIVEEAIAGREDVTFDRAHFTGFGESTLNYELVYYIERSDYGFFMDMQHAVDLEILKRFSEEGIEFAYPTQTLFVQKN